MLTTLFVDPLHKGEVLLPPHDQIGFNQIICPTTSECDEADEDYDFILKSKKVLEKKVTPFHVASFPIRNLLGQKERLTSKDF